MPGERIFQQQYLRRRLNQPLFHPVIPVGEPRFYVVEQLSEVGVSVRRRVPSVLGVSFLDPLDEVNGFLDLHSG